MELKFRHFVILQALDVLTTWYGLTFLHLQEANPFAHTMFGQFGLVNALIAMKIVGLMVIYGILHIYPQNVRKLAIAIMCVIFSLVIINNVYWMIKFI